jgi:hypothetical protein
MADLIITDCPANVRETFIGFGFKPQSALNVKNLDAELWSLTKTNATLATVTPQTETDALDIGKGDEFPTQIFPTSMDASFPITKYGSSEFFAWLFCFATGHATKAVAGTGGFDYQATLSDPVVNCINLPPFSYVEQIRTGANAVVDRGLIGMVINDFQFDLASGPGRANCTAQCNCVGTGAFSNPSGSVIPPVTTEHFLNAASALISIAGIDYVLSKSFISLSFKYNNNVRLPSGYYPGSGTQNGYAIRGRMEYGNRDISLTFQARAAKGSTELNMLLTQPMPEHPIAVSVTGAAIGTANHMMKISAPRTVLSSVVVGDADGIVTVDCTVTFLKPTSGAMITMEATTTQDAILGL